MGRELEKVNAAWSEHSALFGESANYGSFLAGWVSGQEAFTHHNTDEVHQDTAPQVGSRIRTISLSRGAQQWWTGREGNLTLKSSDGQWYATLDYQTGKKDEDVWLRDTEFEVIA